MSLGIPLLQVVVDSRGWSDGDSDGQPGRGMQGRDAQMTSPVNQGYTVKRVTELLVLNR